MIATPLLCELWHVLLEDLDCKVHQTVCLCSFGFEMCMFHVNHLDRDVPDLQAGKKPTTPRYVAIREANIVILKLSIDMHTNYSFW